MFRTILAIVGCTMAIVMAVASAASASERPIGYAPCHPNPAPCTPALTELPAPPDWLRVMRSGSVRSMPIAVTDLHAYGPSGRALAQGYSRSADAYTFRSRSGKLLAAYDRVNRTWYAYGLVLVAGWRA